MGMERNPMRCTICQLVLVDGGRSLTNVAQKEHGQLSISHALTFSILGVSALPSCIARILDAPLFNLIILADVSFARLTMHHPHAAVHPCPVPSILELMSSAHLSPLQLVSNTREREHHHFVHTFPWCSSS